MGELCCRSTPILEKLSVEVNRVDGPGSKCPGSHYSIENIMKISQNPQDGSEVRIDSAKLEYVNLYKNGEDSPDQSTKTGQDLRWTFPRHIYTFPDAKAAKEFAEASQKLVAASPFRRYKQMMRDLELDAPSIQGLSEDTIDLLLRTG